MNDIVRLRLTSNRWPPITRTASWPSSARPDPADAIAVGPRIGITEGTFDWSFEPHGQQTKTSVDVRYELAGGALGKAIDALVLERTNEKTIEHMLQNMQRILAREGASTT